MLKIRNIRWLTLLVVMVFSVVGVAGLMVMPASAQGFPFPDPVNGPYETGNICAEDYGGVSCTANDVRFEDLSIANLVQGCTLSPVDGQYYMTATFNALITADGSPNRYDIGFYLALDGGSAYDGDSCFHGYLDGALTNSPTYGDNYPFGLPNGVSDTINGPWWDGNLGGGGGEPIGDMCGDMETNTEVVITLPPIRVPCVDQNGNSAADIHVCTSWNNTSAGDACTGVMDAIPGTGSKCSCSVLDLGFSTTAITSLEAMASADNNTSVAPFAGIAISLALITLLALLNHRRNVSMM